MADESVQVQAKQISVEDIKNQRVREIMALLEWLVELFRGRGGVAKKMEELKEMTAAYSECTLDALDEIKETLTELRNVDLNTIDEEKLETMAEEVARKIDDIVEREGTRFDNDKKTVKEAFAQTFELTTDQFNQIKIFKNDKDEFVAVHGNKAYITPLMLDDGKIVIDAAEMKETTLDASYLEIKFDDDPIDTLVKTFCDLNGKNYCLDKDALLASRNGEITENQRFILSRMSENDKPSWTFTEDRFYSGIDKKSGEFRVYDRNSDKMLVFAPNAKGNIDLSLCKAELGKDDNGDLEVNEAGERLAVGGIKVEGERVTCGFAINDPALNALLLSKDVTNYLNASGFSYEKINLMFRNYGEQLNVDVDKNKKVIKAAKKLTNKLCDKLDENGTSDEYTIHENFGKEDKKKYVTLTHNKSGMALSITFDKDGNPQTLRMKNGAMTNDRFHFILDMNTGFATPEFKEVQNTQPFAYMYNTIYETAQPKLDLKKLHETNLKVFEPVNDYLTNGLYDGKVDGNTQRYNNANAKRNMTIAERLKDIVNSEEYKGKNEVTVTVDGRTYRGDVARDKIANMSFEDIDAAVKDNHIEVNAINEYSVWSVPRDAIKVNLQSSRELQKEYPALFGLQPNLGEKSCWDVVSEMFADRDTDNFQLIYVAEHLEAIIDNSEHYNEKTAPAMPPEIIQKINNLKDAETIDPNSPDFRQVMEYYLEGGKKMEAMRYSSTEKRDVVNLFKPQMQTYAATFNAVAIDIVSKGNIAPEPKFIKAAKEMYKDFFDITDEQAMNVGRILQSLDKENCGFMNNPVGMREFVKTSVNALGMLNVSGYTETTFGGKTDNELTDTTFNAEKRSHTAIVSAAQLRANLNEQFAQGTFDRCFLINAKDQLDETIDKNFAIVEQQNIPRLTEIVNGMQEAMQKGETIVKVDPEKSKSLYNAMCHRGLIERNDVNTVKVKCEFNELNEYLNKLQATKDTQATKETPKERAPKDKGGRDR